MSLRDTLIRQIQQAGPMRLDAYMTTCLLHPTMGYYTTQMPFGAEGDFVTAPEISQMFGELIGLALAQTWLDQGAPAPFTLAELGPGRGTLMQDALRAAGAVKGFRDAAKVVLVEASPALVEIQRETLKDDSVTWVTDADALPQQPLMLIANEFFDALPVRQFIRQGDQWRERQVGLSDGVLAFGLAPAGPQPALDYRLADTGEGDLVETCSAYATVMAPVARRIAAYGGAALVIDYGDWRTKGDSFQAVQSHTKVGPLDTPGRADLTAHVDFEALATAAKGCLASTLTPQGVFLERLGITARAQALAGRLRGPALESHIAAHRRLTHPAEMGNLFKVLGLTAPQAAPPAGLETGPT